MNKILSILHWVSHFSFTAPGGMAISILLLALSGLLNTIVNIWSWIK